MLFIYWPVIFFASNVCFLCYALWHTIDRCEPLSGEIKEMGVLFYTQRRVFQTCSCYKIVMKQLCSCWPTFQLLFMNPKLTKSQSPTFPERGILSKICHKFAI